MSEENTQTTVVLPENLVNAKTLFDAAYTDAVKFYTKGTASAAARSRKAFSAQSKLNKVIRKEIQVDKKAKVAERKADKAA